jgi:hypothetical protein
MTVNLIVAACRDDVEEAKKLEFDLHCDLEAYMDLHPAFKALKDDAYFSIAAAIMEFMRGQRERPPVIEGLTVPPIRQWREGERVWVSRVPGVPGEPPGHATVLSSLPRSDGSIHVRMEGSRRDWSVMPRDIELPREYRRGDRVYIQSLDVPVGGVPCWGTVTAGRDGRYVASVQLDGGSIWCVREQDISRNPPTPDPRARRL